MDDSGVRHGERRSREGDLKEYCAQCHGFTGKGDGPAASGLEPKPAIHANIPFEKMPTDYLYNVINHGGAAMENRPACPIGD